MGRQKHKQPFNPFLREQYRIRLREYKRQCRSSRHLFWSKHFEQIENSLHDPKEFWEKWKQCSEEANTKSSPNITGGEWFNHFSNLHGPPNSITEPSTCSSIREPPSDTLNKPFTKDELFLTIKKLKKGKATGYDRISNEMLINAPQKILFLILDYINVCLEKSLISNSICYDIIYPIFKDGMKLKPENYRGICISSALLKLLTTLMNERLKVRVNELNLINKNQIGFRESSRTSDHLLTLKSIVKKYVTIGKVKLYACFIDFKKAFDSVWHIGLFKKTGRPRSSWKIIITN